MSLLMRILIGAVVGIGGGLALGYLLDNYPIGIAVGVPLGLGLVYVVTSRGGSKPPAG